MRMFELFDFYQELKKRAKVTKMTSDTMVIDEGCTPHLRDIMDIACNVWKGITAEQVMACWRKTTCVHFNMTVNITAVGDNDVASTSEMSKKSNEA